MTPLSPVALLLAATATAPADDVLHEKILGGNVLRVLEANEQRR